MNYNLEKAFDKFWVKLPTTKTALANEFGYIEKNVRMKLRLTAKQDISCGLKAVGIGSSQGYEQCDYDEDLMIYLMKHPHLEKDEIAIIDKISFEYWPEKNRYDIVVSYEIRKNDTNFKCQEGIICLTRLDNPKDADIFLQAAKKALQNRRRPVTVDYKYEDLID